MNMKKIQLGGVCLLLLVMLVPSQVTATTEETAKTPEAVIEQVSDELLQLIVR